MYTICRKYSCEIVSESKSGGDRRGAGGGLGNNFLPSTF